MSISLPIEDLSRLRVWAHLSQSGQPVLSMTLKADASPRPSTSASSGIYVNFERCIENGCWSLAMDATVMQQDFGTTGDSRMSLDASESSFLDPSSQSGVPDIPHVAESCIPDVPGIETDPSNFEMSSLLAWLSSQEEAKAVQNPDEYMSLGLLPGIPHSARSPQTSTSTTEETCYDMLFTGLSCSSIVSSTSSSPSTVSEPSQDEDSDTSSSQNSRQVRSHKRKRHALPCLHPSCTRKFMNEHTRRKHMQTHADKPKRSFPCTMGCSERFSRQHDRFRHEVAKHGYQSQWTCDECYGFFSSEKSRSTHKCTKGGRWKISFAKP